MKKSNTTTTTTTTTYEAIYTADSKYICREVVEEDGKLTLIDACLVEIYTGKDEDDYENQEVTHAAYARDYMFALLREDLEEVTLPKRRVERRYPAIKTGPLIELLIKYLPDAERTVRANMILEELCNLANITQPEKSIIED